MYLLRSLLRFRRHPGLAPWSVLGVALLVALLAPSPSGAVPVVVSTTPADQSIGVPLGAAIVVRFAAPLDPATVVPANVLVTSSQQGTLAASVTWNPGALEIRVDPQRNFLAGERVTVTLGRGIHDTLGQSLPNGRHFEFSARTAPVPGGGFGTSSAAWGIGSIAFCLSVGDLTGDGLPEAVFSNVVPDSLSILTPDGAGHFSRLASIAQPSATLPRGVAIGDLDGDGRPDLVCCASGPNRIFVYRNLGGGSFAPATVYATGATPYAAYLGDLDADGDLDVATANFNGQTVSILKNLGGGTLAPFVDYSAGAGADSPRYVDGADIDGDGDIDLVCCNGYSYDVSVLVNDGTGAFTARSPRYPVGAGPQYLAVQDFTGDHVADIVTVNSLAETVSLLRGNGDGTFQPAVDASVAGQYPYGLDVVDVDGDADLDLLIPVRGADAWQIVRNDGAGHFAAGELHPGGLHCHTVGAADWDRDGDIDVIAGFAISRDMYYYAQSPTPALVSTLPRRNANGVAPDGPIQIVFSVDLAPQTVVPSAFSVKGSQSGGHALSVAWSGRERRATLSSSKRFLPGEVVTLVLEGGVIQSTTGIPFPGDVLRFVISGAPSPGMIAAGSPIPLPGSDPVDVAAADFDADGRCDLAVANLLSGDVTLLLTAGTGTPAPAGSIAAGTSPVALATADFDADGDVDLAVADLAASSVDVLLNSAGGFGAPAAFSVDGAPLALSAGDVDRDGDEDLVVTIVSPPGVRVLTNQGDGTFVRGPFLATVVAPTDVAIADLDRDGTLDVVTVLAQLDEAQVFLGGAPGLRAGGLFRTGSVPMGLFSGDADGDGHVDLACSNYGGASASLLKNTGGGAFAAPVELIAASLPRGIWGGDLTGDAAPDLVVVNSGAGNLSLFRSLGGGRFDAAITFPVGTTPYAVAGGDFDGNGRTDLAVVNRSSRDLSLFWSSSPVGVVEPTLAAAEEAVRAWPNPFATEVNIQLALPRAAAASLDVFDVTGRSVARLLGGPVAAGTRLVHWDGRDTAGRRVGSGVYFLRLDVDGRRWTRRVLHVR
ncbi:MAG: FG-GAP-like repeat-containing protein [bacterium]